MSKKTALGRGFEGLIPTGFSVTDVATPGEQIKQMLLSDIVTNPGQPRKEFDENSIKELADSIKQHGVIQPIVVTPYKDKYRIVAGERRFRASQLAKLTKIPAIIRNHAELEELEISLVENVQRVDLSPLEQAVSIVRLRDQFSLSIKEIAKKLGKAETTLSNIIRLLNLPKNAVNALVKNQITEGHARAILSLKNDEKQQEILLNKIIVQKLSVREAENYVKNLKNTAKKSKTSPKNSPEIEKVLSTIKLESNVIVKEGKNGKGTISLYYKNLSELKILVEKLNK